METPILQRTIICPKCQTKTMRIAHGENTEEYFSDCCHYYWTVNELVNQWDYDLGDFGDSFPLEVYSEISKKNDFARNNNLHPWTNLPFFIYPTKTEVWDFITLDQTYELDWKNKTERDNAYEMVDRMFLGIPEWDLDGTTNDGIDTGLYR